MKKSLPAFMILLLISPIFLKGNKHLGNLIKKKQFDQIASLTIDNTYLQLKAYFRQHRGIAFELQSSNQLMYFVKFQDRAEIGLISYQVKNGQYSEILLKPLIKPLYYIEKFSQYVIQNETITLGDATLHLKQGTIFKITPYNHLYLFQGSCEFQIKPNDVEEQRTIQYLFRKDTFIKKNNSAVLYLPNTKLLTGKQKTGELQKIKNKDTRQILATFQDNFGIWIKQFHEKWYLPFPSSLHAVIFKRGRRSQYKYFYNESMTPDTMLVTIPKNRYILSYNSIKSPKFAFGSGEGVRELSLNLFFNPKQQFLSGTSRITFQDSSDLKQIRLNKELTIRGFRNPENENNSFLNANGNYYVMGENIKTISLYYSGKMGTDRHQVKDRPRTNYAMPDRKIDEFFVLGKGKDFFPWYGDKFFKATISITLPEPYKCLATGRIMQFGKIGERNLFKFQTKGTRNLSLIYGNFSKLRELKTKIPIHIYGSKDLSLPLYFKLEEMEQYFNFLVNLYGKLDIPQLNILIRRWPIYGGISHNGMIIFNLATLPSSKVWLEFSTRNMFMDVPVMFSSDLNRDNMIHELAHQWWGNMVSWNTFRDVWILEGGAQLSTLLYLESILTKKEFLNIVERKVKSWVFKRHNAGPIIYGQRIINITRDRSAYQSIVYNKSLLVFLMFRELVGRDEFSKRIQKFFSDLKFQTVSTTRFIRFMSQDDEQIKKFFRKWLYSRQLPKLKVDILINGKNADLHFFQQETDFIFPIRLQIRTKGGTVYKRVIINQQRQRLRVSQSESIRSIDILTDYSPIRLVK